MLIQDFEGFDNGFMLVQGGDNTFKLKGVTSLEDPNEDHLLLINNKTYWKKYCDLYDHPDSEINLKKIALVFGKKF